ncbi:MAG TPA: bifunctional riboflavin kinase/FAD synthetase [Algoriphagus sp.]|jgi:riboflavin kinase/FMN adenylyltransferase|uniref:Riboflavin biosynthesis protein n=1 Tax=Algoriphagus ornithinivorans TaxID=226506 RepID=A0A1I5CY60_9BACT|nr:MULTISPECIES: bifunctional riboflavin kinase/FAD synthetase [Algoriphagus]MAL12052.1 bifunctional riboflavin kinase/FAD synthetase [Algoriphagus sp.]QYH38534.1 bifunctional riboflavin kinase/FAD synthetase [Algoriphagus sp. NBT04N3]SFN91888.1 riboflavin kinase / FMN adenylyltransferase [Algoriphagus ornithinivorans]HAD53117.1 bifunctional riboflavin kinase/FAD synthetase [Algoriphagus sp.]HAH37161.1 bifunctional riboflavin kinase/FAD synthetase [Algoriphagus sp.]|tara:strand:+ start:1437 stop:2360 length:924 start_codon:yes stop_codon:yes gene_type:complete
MKIYEGLNEFLPVTNPVVTSGTFDGVHLGHQKILQRIREIARSIGGETVMITFWPHPRLVLYPQEHKLRLLSTFEEKAKLLRQFGIDHLVTIPFTKEFSQLSSREFIDQVLVEKIQTRKLVIGYDHRFGKNREGSFEYLKQNSAEFGFELEEISRQDVDEIGVSSTKIRKALESGDIETANSYLGRSYELNGLVIKGQQIGRSIGFPTANIHIPNDYKLIPKDGVYAVETSVNGSIYKSMLNIGNRPTVDGNKKTVEAHLFDFQGDLYDKQLTIYLKAYLREEQKFENLDALKEQLLKDQQQAKSIL